MRQDGRRAGRGNAEGGRHETAVRVPVCRVLSLKYRRCIVYEDRGKMLLTSSMFYKEQLICMGGGLMGHFNDRIKRTVPKQKNNNV